MDPREELLHVFEALRAESLTMMTELGRLQLYKLTALGAVFFAAGAMMRDRPPAAIAALLAAPVLAVCIDTMIESRNAATRRIGCYIRTQIEPILFDPQRLQTEIGPRVSGFVPWELYVIIGPFPRPRWSLRWLSSWALTAIASAASLLALHPSVAVFGEGLGVRSSVYFPWATLVCVLVFAELWILRTPRAYAQVGGHTGDAVLVPGAYAGKCSCGAAAAPVVLDRGSRLPGSPDRLHQSHAVSWTLKSADAGVSQAMTADEGARNA
jgi:hypothetical protein